jgi:uncharacterized protein YcbK (DUF882 family)
MSRRFSKNFDAAELACHDGSPVPVLYYDNATEVCRRAQVLRDLLGTTLKVNSGYRTLEYNRKVGGAKDSMHLSASALDLRSLYWTADQLADLYEGLIRLKLVPDGGLGRYDTFIHIDIGRPRRWDERTKKAKAKP